MRLPVWVRLPTPQGSHYSIAAGERSEPAGGQPCEMKRASKRSNARVRARPASPVCMARPSTLSGVRPPWGRHGAWLPCPQVRPWLTRGYRVVRPPLGPLSPLVGVADGSAGVGGSPPSREFGPMGPSFPPYGRRAWPAVWVGCCRRCCMSAAVMLSRALAGMKMRICFHLLPVSCLRCSAMPARRRLTS